MIATILALTGLSGCETAQRTADEPQSHSGLVWIASHRPVFAAIHGEALYALAPAEGRDLLVTEETDERARGPRGEKGRLTWLVEVPAEAPLGKPLDFGRDSSAGWLLEQIEGMPAHAAPLTGRVIIHERTGDALTATLMVRALIGRAGPAAALPPPECNGRFVFIRRRGRANAP